MKTKSLIAVGIAAASLVIAFVQLYPSKAQQPIHIEGSWRLDTAYATSVTPIAPALLLAVFPGKDSTHVRFNADSTLVFLTGTTNESTRYYLKDSVLYIRNQDQFEPYRILQYTDSTLTYSGKDSVVMRLRKD